MYTLGFLGLWSIALVAALFQSAYIWIHYLCTEEPDMKVLFGPSGSSPHAAPAHHRDD